MTISWTIPNNVPAVMLLFIFNFRVAPINRHKKKTKMRNLLILSWNDENVYKLDLQEFISE